MVAGWLLDAPLFADRAGAGRELVRVLPPDLGRETVVVGLARGGVLVAAEVAAALDAPLDVLAVRKVRHPYQPEFALGAVAPGGDGVYLRSNEGLGDAVVAEAILDARREADVLDRRLHESHLPLDCLGRPILLVDDGLATGATMVAAARWARSRSPRQVIAAVPVAAQQSIRPLLDEVDLVFCPHVRSDLVAVGVWYADFRPVGDGDVLALLDAAAARRGAPAGAGGHRA